MSHLVPIDGGVGVQIPQHIISAGHLEHADLLFEITPCGVLIKPEHQKLSDSLQSKHPRSGWAKYYAAPEKEENLLQEVDHEFDEEDWQWEEK